MNIFQRINEVQKEVEYVQKDAVISGGGTYKAVTHDQVVSVIRKSMVKNGIVSYPEQLKGSIDREKITKNGSVQYLYDADYAIHFVNIENPEDRLTSTINSHALDSGDKAPGKALTYATKAAMLKVFNLETGENDESRTAEKVSYSESQKEIYDDFINQSESNPIDFLEFVSQLTAEAQTELYNSGEKGQKTKIKKKHGELIKSAHKKIDDYVDTMKLQISESADDELREFCEELTNFEKSLVAQKLTDIELNYIKELTK